MSRSHAETVAMRKLRTTPEGAEMCGWRVMEDTGDLMVFVGVARVLTRGPRKGTKTWSKPYLKAVVTAAELSAEEERFEREEGKCKKCMGTGETLAGWSAESGNRFVVCSRCGGNGKAPEVAL